MKKINSLAVFVFIFFNTLSIKAQNVSNPFVNPYVLPATVSTGGSFTYGITNPWNQNGVAGEYLIQFDHFKWYDFTYAGNYILAYKIETVSFPFAPACISTGCSQTTNRHLNSFIGQKNAFTLPHSTYFNSSGYSLNDQLVIETPITALFGNRSQYSKLSTVYYAGDEIGYDPIGIPHNQYGCFNCDIILPHTVLKHTIYLICSNNSTSNIIDSVSYIYMTIQEA